MTDILKHLRNYMTFLLLSEEMKKWDLYVDPINRLQSQQSPNPNQAHLRHGINTASLYLQCQQGPRRWAPGGGGEEKGECTERGNLLPGEALRRLGLGPPGVVREPAITASCVSITMSATHDAERALSRGHL